MLRARQALTGRAEIKFEWCGPPSLTSEAAPDAIAVRSMSQMGQMRHCLAQKADICAFMSTWSY